MIDISKFRGPLSWSVLSLLVIVVYGIIAVTNSLSPLLQRTASEVEDTQTTALLAMHDDMITTDVSRFKGRSAFFKPVRKAPPPPPPPPPRPVDDNPGTPVPDPGPPPAPATYMGPELIAIIGDEAWFRGTGSGVEAVIRIQSGEETNGLKVVSTALPSMVTVEYRRGVYEIDLFSTEEPFFLKEPPPTPETGFLKEVDSFEETPASS